MSTDDKDVCKPETEKTPETDFDDMPPLIEDNEDENIDEDDEIEQEIEEDDDEYDEEEDDLNSESDSESEEEEYEPMYILSDDRKPIRYSDDMQRLVVLRDYLVKRETTKFIELGKIYVAHSSSETEDVTIISYMDRNLLWKSERLLKKFIIRRINKI